MAIEMCISDYGDTEEASFVGWISVTPWSSLTNVCIQCVNVSVNQNYSTSLLTCIQASSTWLHN